MILPGGEKLISAAEDRVMGVAVWDINQGIEVGHLEETERGALALAITPDGKKAVSGDMDGVLRIWDLEQLHLLHTIQAHLNPMLMPGGNPLYGMALAITLDGKRVITASVDQNLKIWELSTGEQLAAFTTESSLWACAVASDCQTIPPERCGRGEEGLWLPRDEGKTSIEGVPFPYCWGGHPRSMSVTQSWSFMNVGARRWPRWVT